MDEILSNEKICDVCGKEFANNIGLQKHKQRKNPCKAPVKLIETPSEFREASKQFNTSLTKIVRQEQGIFFTPKKARDILFAKISLTIFNEI